MKEKGLSGYQLRYAAGLYWLLDMEQQGEEYRRPLPLNEVGAEIWKCLGKGMSVKEIADVLNRTYGVETKEAVSDVQQFCGQLASEGILVGEAYSK